MVKTEKEASPDAAKVNKEGSLKRKAPEISDLSSEVFSLTVGTTPNTKTFTIHKELACFHSPFFRGVCSGRSRSTTISDTTVEAAEVLVRWLYSDRIRDKENKLPVARVLYEAWMLADKLAIPELQNTVIPLIVEKEKEIFTVATEVGPAVYNKTQPGSLLRKFHVDQIAVALTAKTMGEGFKSHPERFPVELLKDLCLTLRANGQGFSWLSDFTRYMAPVPDEEQKTT